MPGKGALPNYYHTKRKADPKRVTGGLHKKRSERHTPLRRSRSPRQSYRSEPYSYVEQQQYPNEPYGYPYAYPPVYNGPPPQFQQTSASGSNPYSSFGNAPPYYGYPYPYPQAPYMQQQQQQQHRPSSGSRQSNYNQSTPQPSYYSRPPPSSSYYSGGSHHPKNNY